MKNVSAIYLVLVSLVLFGCDYDNLSNSSQCYEIVQADQVKKVFLLNKCDGKTFALKSYSETTSGRDVKELTDEELLGAYEDAYYWQAVKQGKTNNSQKIIKWEDLPE